MQESDTETKENLRCSDKCDWAYEQASNTTDNQTTYQQASGNLLQWNNRALTLYIIEKIWITLSTSLSVVGPAHN